VLWVIHPILHKEVQRVAFWSVSPNNPIFFITILPIIRNKQFVGGKYKIVSASPSQQQETPTKFSNFKQNVLTVASWSTFISSRDGYSDILQEKKNSIRVFSIMTPYSLVVQYQCTAMKSSIFWVIALCNSLQINWCVRGTWCPASYLLNLLLNYEDVCYFQQTTWYYISR
jgi:hypothetical protein